MAGVSFTSHDSEMNNYKVIEILPKKSTKIDLPTRSFNESFLFKSKICILPRLIFYYKSQILIKVNVFVSSFKVRIFNLQT